MGGVVWWGGVPGALLLALRGAPPPAPHPGVQMGWCWLENAQKCGVYWGDFARAKTAAKTSHNQLFWGGNEGKRSSSPHRADGG